MQANLRTPPFLLKREVTHGAYTLRAKDLKEIHHNDLDDDSDINASPALSGSQLFIRSNRYLYCIGAAK